MSALRPFRFGVGAFEAPSAAAWGENSRRAEALGYDALGISDHFRQGLFAAVPALTAAALAATTLRVSCTVFAYDFRHPVVLAREMATLDVLSDGRLEVGIGAGYRKSEYDQAGIPFDPPGMRVARMQEAVHILKGLWAEGPFSFTGEYYTIRDLDGWPTPIQRPHPPVYIGAGGKRLLSFAAHEADIIGIIAPALPSGVTDFASDTEERVAEQVGWVREAAGERLARLELHALIWGAAVTDDRRAAVEGLAGEWALSAEHVLASPYFLIGSVDAIVERLEELRERYHLSYFSVFPKAMEAFAPVVARLAGT